MTEEEKEQVVDQLLLTGESPYKRALAGERLRGVMDKHAGIQKLEASIVELSQMFNDLAILISTQVPASASAYSGPQATRSARACSACMGLSAERLLRMHRRACL